MTADYPHGPDPYDRPKLDTDAEAAQRVELEQVGDTLARVSNGAFTMRSMEWSPGMVVVTLMTPDGARSFVGYEQAATTLESLIGMYTVIGTRTG